jgi:hypothetical protein
MERQPSISIVGVVSMPLGLAGAALGAQGTLGGKPNVLVILTDDMRWDAMGVAQREQGDKALFT